MSGDRPAPLPAHRSPAWLAAKCLGRFLLPCLMQTAVIAAESRRLPVAQAAEQMDLDEVFLAVSLNREDLRETVLCLRDRNGRLRVRANDLRRWRLRLPGAPPISFRGEVYYALDGVSGLSYAVHDASQSIAIEATPDLFLPTEIRGLSPSPVPVPSALGGFLNYDGFAQTVIGGQTQVNALAEFGAFSSWGVGTLDLIGRDLAGTSRFVRLDTTWTTDRPAHLASLRVGDAISRPAEWGGAVRFGGVQWSTNFATQSRFISFPLPTLAGESALPSTLDLYVNNALRMRRELPPGPFSIVDLPLVTGSGDARLVVRDLLGREQFITQPYYVSPRLLRAGLQDYSYEIGLVRKNFGLASFDYGRWFAAGTHRLGFTDRFTGEVHGEILSGQQTVGLNGAMLWPEFGVFSLSLAGSSGGSGAGVLAGFGYERQTRWLGFRGSTRFSTDRFTQTGLNPGQPAPRQISAVAVSLSGPDYGSLSLGYIHQDYRDRPDVQLLSAGYNLTLGKLGYLSLGYFRSLHGDPDPSVILTYTLALGERGNISLGGTLQRGNDQATLRIQRNLPRGSGYGYRLLASGGSREQFEAGVSLQNDMGLYTFDASRFGNQTGIRGSISGGVALMGGRPFFARRLTNSFALVRVPDYPGVRVYADNQPVGKTDAKGDALIPQLRAYDRNLIRIEQSDLPLDARIDTLDLVAVPYYRSGHLLEFPVRRSRGALLRIVLGSGEALPAGATVRIIGGKEEFPVALNGDVYVAGLAAHNRLRAFWRGQSCEFAVAFPETREPLPHLGTFSCLGVAP